jgi:signal transduction histidine kinase
VGLGLFIVREIVAAHGGQVEVASSDAGGTTFTVRLPREGS